jgi:hypothetical protein
VYLSASDFISGASPFCMLKNSIVCPVSRGICGGVVSGDVA